MFKLIKKYFNDKRDRKAQLIFNKVLSQDDLTPHTQAGMCTAMTTACTRGLISSSELQFGLNVIGKFTGNHIFLAHKLQFGQRAPIIFSETAEVRATIYRNWAKREAIVDAYRETFIDNIEN